MSFIFIIILIIVAVAGIGLGIYFASRKSVGGLIAQQATKKNENKEMILGFLKLNTKGDKKVTNNEVERLLDVSDATATRYLNELEEEGKIQQIGETGRAVFYILK